MKGNWDKFHMRVKKIKKKYEKIRLCQIMCENKDGMKFRMGSVDIKESETKNVYG